MNARGTDYLLQRANTQIMLGKIWGGSVGTVPTPDGDAAPSFEVANIASDADDATPPLMCANGFAAPLQARIVAGRTLPIGFPSPRLAQRLEGKPDHTPPEYASTARSGGEAAGHRRSDRQFFGATLEIGSQAIRRLESWLPTASCREARETAERGLLPAANLLTFGTQERIA